MHLISSAVRMTVDHQLLVNAVMPREQLEADQAKYPLLCKTGALDCYQLDLQVQEVT